MMKPALATTTYNDRKRSTCATALAAFLTVISSSPALHAQVPPPQGAPAPPQAAPPAPPAEAPPASEGHTGERTPPRLSFTNGEVSFWRPGAEDWAPAQINTPLAPGDALYAGTGATLELQIGSRAFTRAGAETQLELENQEPDFLQFKITAGHASLDLRGVKAGQTIEIDTPNATFAVETAGYYRVDITDDTTTFIARRGGHAVMTPAGGEALSIAPSEEVVVQGADTPSVGTYAAPELDAWDRWNYERTDHLLDAVSARYVPPGVYGIDALDHHGTWRVTPEYGSVWVPEVAPGWAPYSAGRWIWDPYYGWTWLDDAPWGWAPCHYGRWVSVSGFWAWAPGPLVVAPVYAPALVAFFGGPHFGVSIGIGAPAVGWVALGWGEPVVPWWGRSGFAGRPWWGGWGGPRVVNNVVIERTTVVNVNTINVYQNARVRNAVVATREDRFGRFGAEHLRVREFDPHQVEPVRGRLPVQPVAASLVPREGHGPRPPQAVLARRVVATRPPHDPTAALREAGLPPATRPAPAARIVAAPRAPRSAFGASRPPFGQQGTTERARPSLPPQFGGSRPGPRPLPPGRSTAPPERPRMPRQSAGPQPSAPPHAPPAVGERRVPQAPAPVPHEPAAREPVPRRPARPAPAAPEGRAPAAPRERPARTLPGEPANRLYRTQPETRGPRANVPAAPRGGAGSAPESAPERRRENMR